MFSRQLNVITLQLLHFFHAYHIYRFDILAQRLITNLVCKDKACDPQYEILAKYPICGVDKEYTGTVRISNCCQFRTLHINRIFQSQFRIKSKHPIERRTVTLNGGLEPLISQLSDQMTGTEIRLGQPKSALYCGSGKGIVNPPALPRSFSGVGLKTL